MTQNVMETSDLYFAAFLKTAKVDLLGTKKDGRRVIFLFDDRKDGAINQLQIEYINRTSKIVALDYADNIKALKSLCHMG